MISASNLKGIAQFEERSARLKVRITEISEFGSLLATVQDEYHNYYMFFNGNSDIKKKMPVESHLFEDITQTWNSIHKYLKSSSSVFGFLTERS